MIYFDNAATTIPKPPEVVTAVAEGLCTLGNPSRGAHGAALNSLRVMLSARQAIGDLFNANPMKVAFTLNATMALNIAIGGIKGHIVTTAAEHNSVLRPLYRRGSFTVTPLDNKGGLSLKSLEDAIKADTEAIVITHASNLTGNVFDIAAVGGLCKRKGIKLIVDAAQTAGLLPIDMQKWNISALCVSGHKSLYAPQGVGFICLAPDFLPPPLIVGGSGQNSFSMTHPDEMPDALEAGTQNSVGIAGLLAGINYVKALGNRVFTDADFLAKRFIEKIKDNKRVVLYGDLDAPVRTPVVALNLKNTDSKNTDSAFVAAELFEKYGIAVRAGAHCAPLMHQALNTAQTGAVRFSFSHFNTRDEIDIAVAALNQIIKEI